MLPIYKTGTEYTLNPSTENPASWNINTSATFLRKITDIWTKTVELVTLSLETKIMYDSCFRLISDTGVVWGNKDMYRPRTAAHYKILHETVRTQFCTEKRSNIFTVKSCWETNETHIL